MPNVNRTRLVLAQQKARQLAKPQPLPDGYTLPKLTAEQRREIYAPKPATSAPEHLQGAQWVRAWRMIERTTYGLTTISAVLFGGLVMGESKKAIKQ